MVVREAQGLNAYYPRIPAYDGYVVVLPVRSRGRVPRAIVTGGPPGNRWNRLAMVSFAFGLVPIVAVAGSIVAIVLGGMAESQAQGRDERGLGLAKWGLWLGIVWLVACCLYIVAFGFLLFTMSQTMGKID